MAFSARTSWDPTPNPLTLALQRHRAEGRPLLDLTLTNPTAAALPYPEAELLDALRPPDALTYEPEPFGIPSAREAVASWYASLGVSVAPEQVVITASSSESYALLFKLLCDPGDEVLVPRPSYPLFEYLATLESVSPRGYPLRYDGEWHLDCGALEEAMGPRTRAVVVVHPNNPTGSYFKRDEAERLAEACAARALALIADEVFLPFTFGADPRRAPSFASRSDVLTCTLGGLSKAAGLPQLKLGWIVVTGPNALRTEALARLELLNDTYLSAGTPVQLALGRLLELTSPVREAIRARTRRNLTALETLHSPASRWSLLATEGGWSAVLRVSRARSELDWCLTLLEQDGVLVHPGHFFDFEQEGFLVLSLLVEPGAFAAAAERLVRRLEAV